MYISFDKARIVYDEAKESFVARFGKGPGLLRLTKFFWTHNNTIIGHIMPKAFNLGT